MQKINDLEKKFKDTNIFEQSLTHRSWVNENPGKRESNERMEFLGDAVLELVVTDYLYHKLPEKPEGYLTALRANIVNTINLAKLARKIDLGKSIYLSKGERQTKGNDNNSLLADTVEAIIGAIFIDQGLDKAKNFILENLLIDLDEKIKEPLKDAKSRLQENSQAQKLAPPKYKVIKMAGPDHAKEFTVEVSISGRIIGKGTGKSKSAAEQKAAAIALEVSQDKQSLS